LIRIQGAVAEHTVNEHVLGRPQAGIHRADHAFRRVPGTVVANIAAVAAEACAETEGGVSVDSVVAAEADAVGPEAVAGLVAP